MVSTVAFRRDTVESLLTAQRALERLRGRDPYRSGVLRLRLERARREWHEGGRTEAEFNAIATEVLLRAADECFAITGAAPTGRRSP